MELPLEYFKVFFAKHVYVPESYFDTLSIINDDVKEVIFNISLFLYH
jgi:hypothetical protein